MTITQLGTISKVFLVLGMREMRRGLVGSRELLCWGEMCQAERVETSDDTTCHGSVRKWNSQSGK